MFLIAIITQCIPNFVMANDKAITDVNKNIIDKSCLSEFEGNGNARMEYTKFSPRYKANLKIQGKGNNFYGKILEVSEDPLFIVSSYKILSIKIEYTKAVVTYCRF